jgi:hypothetical protein
MEGTQYCTKEAVLKHAQEAIGIPLRSIDKTGRLSTGKGAIGTVIVGIIFFNEPATFWRLFFITTLILSVIGLKMI